ncbi:MAG TPA: hypothetical protein VD793_04635 [Gemmatimonadales bacterium]|nr:hypothetical protein [Gemmatimonadales bacterium]
MARNTALLVLLTLAGAATNAAAQATGTPSFNAPYRAFERHEFGGAISFNDFDAGTALEAVYRFASGEFDVGLRGGFLFSRPLGQDEAFLAGAEGRYRVITHSVDFPLDGALIFGGGLSIDGGTNFQFPFGLSLGRRVDVQDSQVSIVPYVQPTLFILNQDLGLVRDTDIAFAVGVGGDFRLSRRFDARVSLGFGDLEGISIAAVWVR